MGDYEDILTDAEREALLTAEPAPELQKVLIVDDNEQAREALKAYLESKGIGCLTADGAHQALVMLELGVKVGVMVTDLRMEPHSGLALIRRVREGSEWAALPIIIVSGDADVKDAIAAMHLSVLDFLLKPLDLDKLVGLVRKELGLV